ncbi:MAG: hypothetical protein JSW40_02085 [Candidatus Omnitrophota bacterium]|nr:MAG: hypothetical protein JSW40_02085 [Candidatus Omnitrophota bacterium]
MKKANIFAITVILCGLIVFACGGLRAYSQEGEPQRGPRQRQGLGGDHRRIGMVIFETLPEEEKEALAELRDKDPEKFKEVAQERIKERGVYLNSLKESDPEKFKEITEKALRTIRQKQAAKVLVFESLSEREKKNLANLKEKNPEKFREAIEKKLKAKGEYLKALKEKNPEKFKEVAQKVHRKIQQKNAIRGLVFEDLTDEERQALAELRKQDPQKLREVLEQKLKEKAEYLKELKETDPEKLREIVEGLRSKVIKREVTTALIFESLSDTDKKALVELRKKDPEAYKEALAERLKEKHEYLKNLKETDSEKFKAVTHKAHQKLQSRMEHLRAKDPEKFEKIVAWRRDEMKKKVEAACKENPQKCKEIKERRVEHIKNLLKELKEEDPERYEKIKQWIKGKREN